MKKINEWLLILLLTIPVISHAGGKFRFSKCTLKLRVQAEKNKAYAGFSAAALLLVAPDMGPAYLYRARQYTKLAKLIEAAYIVRDKVPKKGTTEVEIARANRRIANFFKKYVAKQDPNIKLKDVASHIAQADENELFCEKVGNKYQFTSVVKNMNKLYVPISNRVSKKDDINTYRYNLAKVLYPKVKEQNDPSLVRLKEKGEPVVEAKKAVKINDRPRGIDEELEKEVDLIALDEDAIPLGNGYINKDNTGAI